MPKSNPWIKSPDPQIWGKSLNTSVGKWTVQGNFVTLNLHENDFSLKVFAWSGSRRREREIKIHLKIVNFKFSSTFTFSTQWLRLIKSKWNTKKCESSKNGKPYKSTIAAWFSSCVFGTRDREKSIIITSISTVSTSTTGFNWRRHLSLGDLYLLSCCLIKSAQFN